MIRPLASLAGILVLVSLLVSCASDSGNRNASNGTNRASTNANRTPAKDDIEELEGLVKVPFHPVEAVWRDETDAGSVRRLVCVIRFAPDDASKVAETASRHRAAQSVELEAENWFPPELVAKSQQSGNETVKGTSYGANDFFQPPFAEGRLVRIDSTNFFVLELSAKP